MSNAAMPRAVTGRVPVVGGPIVVDTFAGTITRVIEPGKPDGPIDACYYESGKPRFASAISHGFDSNQWRWPDEHEALRPRSALELVSEAIGRGERAPVKGAAVIFGRNIATNIHHVQIEPTRGRIRTVHSMTELDVDVFTKFPPDDPMQPDHPVRVDVRSTHAAAQNLHLEKLGHPDGWCWPDEELIRPFGPFERADIHKSYKCTRFKDGTKRVTPIYVGNDPRDTNLYGLDRTAASLCGPCTDAIRSFLADVVGNPEDPTRTPVDA